MSGDFKNYSSVQQPQISPLAKVQLHTAGEGGKSHLQGGKPEEMRWSRCTHQAVQVHITEERLIVFFESNRKFLRLL